MLEEWRCDLLITDVQMPNMNGLDLAALARFMGYTGPILLISAFLSDDEALDNFVLREPFAPSDLIDRIREVEEECAQMSALIA